MRMREGWTIQQIQAAILASPEYYNAEMPNDGYWIWRLYRDVLGRDVGREINAWINAGADADWSAHSTGPTFSGYARGVIALGIVASVEALGRQLEADYPYLLGRSIDPVGREGWVALMQRGVRYEEVIGWIIASEEYDARAQRS